MNTPEIKTTSAASRTWMLHEHHGWTRLASNYGTRAEFDEACDAAIAAAADNSSDQPCLFERADFLDCEYYESQFQNLKSETTHIVATGRSEIEQFTDEAAAKKAYDAACRDHGLDRLTCDRGGHAGETERVDVEDIRVYVTAPSGSYKFDYASTDSGVDLNDLIDAGIPTGEAESVLLAIEAELATIAAE